MNDRRRAKRKCGRQQVCFNNARRRAKGPGQHGNTAPGHSQSERKCRRHLLFQTHAASVLLGCTLLWGCTTLPRTAGTESFPRLPPASYGGSVQAEQILTMTRNGSTNTLQVYVEITPAKILLVGTSALGQRVLSLVYDEHGLRTESGAPGAAAAEQMLIDFRLVAWPLTALQAAVVGTRWRIEEPRSGTRQVWRDGKAYAEIHYADRANAQAPPAGHRSSSVWAGRVWLVNLEHGYTLDIESKILN